MTTQLAIMDNMRDLSKPTLKRSSLIALCLASAFCVQFLRAGAEKAEVNGIEIVYETFGSIEQNSILLIAGLGAQLTMWHDDLCEELLSRGYHVIRFDNRDSGLSTHLDSMGSPDWEAIGEAASAGQPPPLPYSLEDMAEDAVGLLDALGVEKAHLVGASMGGAIAQLVAIQFPHRTLSLTSIFAETGNPDMPGPSDDVLAMPPAPPQGSPIGEIVDREFVVWRTIGSPDYPVDEPTLRASIRRDVKRSYNPAAMERQAAAVMFAGDRRQQLRQLAIPSVVLHGDADPLVPIENGRDTAENIPDAELRVIKGMGHDLPLALMEEVADAVDAAASQAVAASDRSENQVDGDEY